MRKILSKKQEAGVSAVIGVILMVAITVAIAATVYVYVSDTLNNEEETTNEIITIDGKLHGYKDLYLVIDNVTYYKVYNGDFTNDYVRIFTNKYVRIELEITNEIKTKYDIISIEVIK